MTLKKRINALVKRIAEYENGKIQVDAPQLREILKVLAIISIETDIEEDALKDIGLKALVREDDPITILVDYGNEPHIQRIAKRNVKAREK